MLEAALWNIETVHGSIRHRLLDPIRSISDGDFEGVDFAARRVDGVLRHNLGVDVLGNRVRERSLLVHAGQAGDTL